MNGCANRFFRLRFSNNTSAFIFEVVRSVARSTHLTPAVYGYVRILLVRRRPTIPRHWEVESFPSQMQDDTTRIKMTAESPNNPPVSRRHFLSQMAAAGMGTAAICGMAAQDLQNLNPLSVENPLTGYPNRGWEKVYRNLYKSDSTFHFLCAPNDTHNCLLRAHVKNGVITRIAPSYGYQKAEDLGGKRASSR